jgi:peptidoglycan hydrolase-like protein with peptidoglycan-binding domain
VSAALPQAPAEPAPAPELDDGRPRRRRRRRVIAGALAVVATAGVAVALADPFAGGGKPKTGVVDNAYPTSLATVTRRSLSSRTSVNGTLEYAGSYSVVSPAAGIATWLPRAGQVIGRGQVLYRLAGRPVVLLYGPVPAFRALQHGMTGTDVRQLNANLVALGYASSSVLDPASSYFSSATKYALEQLQAALGVKETGTLELGQALFLPRALRITNVMATLGAPVAPGAVIAQASSTTRRVAVELDAAQQASVRVGNRVAITLPNNRTTPGVVTSVGRVAHSSGGSSGSPKVPVYIAPRDPRVTGTLDKAPVQVQITTASVRHALVVPIDALLALAGGGYAVEAVDAAGAHRLVPVTLGLFDDADGLVQVSGSGLFSGQRIVVPST